MSETNGPNREDKKIRVRVRHQPKPTLTLTFAASRPSTSGTLWDRDQQARGLLQRRRACGTYTIESDGCRRKRVDGFLHRATVTNVADKVGGQRQVASPAYSSARYDFSQVPVHTVEAHPNSGPYQLGSRGGQVLIADELTQVVQRAYTLDDKVNPKGFNMIGETHSETEGREEEEKKYLVEKCGLEYKLENDLFSKGLGEGQELPDPVHLRLGAILEFIIKHVQDMKKKGKKKSKKKGDAQTLIGLIERVIPGIIKGSVAQMELNDYWVKKVGKEFEAKKELQKLYDNLKTEASKVKNKEKKQGKASKKKWSGYLDNIENESKSMKDKISKPLDMKHSFSFLRSMAMHDYANKNNKKKIAWKVGDAHVDDIKTSKEGREVKYTLVGNQEFNNLLLANQKDKEKDTKT